MAKPWKSGQVFKVHVKRMDDRTTLSGPALRRLMFQYSLDAGDSVIISMNKMHDHKFRITVYKDGGKGDEKRPAHGCLFYMTC